MSAPAAQERPSDGAAMAALLVAMLLASGALGLGWSLGGRLVEPAQLHRLVGGR